MTLALPLFSTAGTVTTSSEIDGLIAADAPVAIGVSGGKDSCAVAFATIDYLNSVGHTGPRLLIHADLGLTEWRESLPICERLADRLGLELIIVRRAKGGMMERWEQRWSDNIARYAALECVQLILPWSTPDMRFCTSELKTSPICAALVRRFPGQNIISVTGIRRQESRGRAKAPIAKPQPRLTSITRGTAGIDWHPIIDWSLDDVLATLRERDFPLHEAYTTYGASRVSCAFCIMSSASDLRAAAGCADHHVLYRRMVDLEIRSTFAFHGDGWLGDVAPNLLVQEQRVGLLTAKSRAMMREDLESRIPRDLLYVKGWPTCVPTRAAAELLCDIRREVSRTVGVVIDFTEPRRLIERYEQLWAEKRGGQR